ncbi:MAG: hypothetical protein HKN87_07740 [Saprospiraceae bacterium]|nr:hypothetical protein [Saprospiraceae bacterium]
MLDHEKQSNYQEDYKDAYLANDFFDYDHPYPSRKLDDFIPEIPEVLPKWLDETRIVCFLVGLFGLAYTLFNVEFFYWQIKSPFLLNLSLLVALGGFVNFIAYPYALKYCLTNGIRRPQLLKNMNGFMVGFALLSLLFFFSFPITGLGLSLILIPAPLLFGLYSRKYINQHEQEYTGIQFPALAIFRQDIKKLAWLTLVIVLTVLLGFLFALVFNLI